MAKKDTIQQGTKTILSTHGKTEVQNSIATCPRKLVPQLEPGSPTPNPELFPVVILVPPRDINTS